MIADKKILDDIFFDLMDWMISFESPNTTSESKFLSWASLRPCQSASASAMLLVTEPILD